MNRWLLTMLSSFLLLATPVLSAQPRSNNPAHPNNLIPPPPAIPSAIIAPQAARQGQFRSSPAAGDQMVIDHSSTPNRAIDNKAQRFIDYIDLTANQIKLPLTLQFQNGTGGGPSYKWLRVSVAGQPFLTEKNFRSSKVLSIDVTGQLGSGSTQIVILAGGPPGATLAWTLTAPAMALAWANPDKARPGEKITLSGRHLSAATRVTFNGRTASIDSKSDNQLNVTVPSNAEPGINSVLVSDGAHTAGPVQVKVKPVPEVTGISLDGAPPGVLLTISGRNFSDKPSENKVTVGGEEAEVTQASKNILEIIIPATLDNRNPSYGLPVVVEVDGVPSNNNVTINISSRFIPKDPNGVNPFFTPSD